MDDNNDNNTVIEFQVAVRTATPEDIECIVQREDGRCMVYSRAGDIQPFESLTPVHDLKSAFLQTNRFVYFVLDPEQNKMGGKKETEALVHLDEIENIMFVEGDPAETINLKQGGELQVLISTDYMAALSLDHGFRLQEHNENDGYALFTRPASKDVNPSVPVS